MTIPSEHAPKLETADPTRCKKLSQDPLSVFICYSWESAEHKAWAYKLAAALTNCGCAVVLDQTENTTWHVVAAYGMSCRNVLLVASPGFTWKAGWAPEPDHHVSERTVFDETQIMLNILESANSFDRIITLLRPSLVCPRAFPIIDFRDDTKFRESLETLLMLLQSNWHIDGVQSEPNFVVLSTQDGRVVGKFVKLRDAEAPRDLDQIDFHPM